MAAQTIFDLGALVKSKYPGSYDDLPDDELGRKVKAKFPGSYDDFSDAPAPVARPLLPPSPLANVQRPPVNPDIAAPPSPEEPTPAGVVAPPGLPRSLGGGDLPPAQPTPFNLPAQPIRKPMASAGPIGPLPQVTAPTDFEQPALQNQAPAAPQVPVPAIAPDLAASVARRRAESAGGPGPTSTPVIPAEQATTPEWKLAAKTFLNTPKSVQDLGIPPPAPGDVTGGLKQGLLNASLGFISPENVAITLATAGLAQAFTGLVNSARGVEIISKLPGNPELVRKVADLASKFAVPGALAAKQGVQTAEDVYGVFSAPTPAERASKASQAALDLLLGASQVWGLQRGVREVASNHPPALADVPEAYAGAPTKVPAPGVQEAAPTQAANLEQAGQRLAAKSWRELGDWGATSNKPFQVQAGDQTLTFEPVGKGYVRATNQDGEVIRAASGSIEQAKSWLDQNVVRSKANPEAGGGLSMGSGAIEPSEIQQVAVAGQPTRSTYDRAVEIANSRPSFGTTTIMREMRLKYNDAHALLGRLVDEGLIKQTKNATGGEVYHRIPQPPPSAEPAAVTAPAISPTTTPGPAPAPEAGQDDIAARIDRMKLPDYVKDTLREDLATAAKLGVVQKIEDLAAARNTAGQTANALELPGATNMDRSRIVRSVRAVLGIPSMDSKTEFNEWLANRNSAPSKENFTPPEGQLNNQPKITSGPKPPPFTGEQYLQSFVKGPPKTAAEESAEAFSDPTYAELFAQADKLAANRARTKPVIPEEGVPERVARVQDARERLAQRLNGKPWSETSNSDRLAIDGLIGEDLGFSADDADRSPTAARAPVAEHPTEALPIEAPGVVPPEPSQVDSRRTVLIPEGIKAPQVPAGMRRTTVKGVGQFIFDPKVIGEKEIRSAVKENRLPAILGTASEPPDSATPGPKEVIAARPSEPQIADGEITPSVSSDIEAEPEPRNFSSTQVQIPEPIAAKVRGFASTIPDSELSADGREADVHATVKYGLHDEEPTAVQKALANEPPITAKIGKVSIFPAKETDVQRGGDQYDVVKLDVDSPDLHRINKKIADSGPHTDTHPTYQPHITLAYVTPGEGQKYVGKEVPGLTGQQVTFPAVRFSGKNKTITDIPLSGEAPARTKPSKLAQGVEEKAIANKLTAGFEGKPEYETVTVPEQAKMAADLIRKDPAKAVRIAMGAEHPEGGLLPESVFVAVENHATANKDVNLLRELATTSSLSSQATAMGQRISMLAARDPNSAVAAIQKISKAREEAAAKRYGPKAKAATKAQIRVEIKAANSNPKTWKAFIEQITCV